MDHEHAPPILAGLPQRVEEPSHSETAIAGSGDSSDGAGGRDERPQTSSTDQQQPLLNPSSQHHPTHDNPYSDFERVPPPAHARSRDSHIRHISSRRHALGSASGHPPGAHSSTRLDWIIPVEEKNHTRRTIGDRLQTTIDNAEKERDKYAKKAVWTGYILNIAIGLQVFLGALTTGLAAAFTSARQAQLTTALLGGLSTIVASYLARARGSGEPELSITRVKDLDQFLRECNAFQLDRGHEYGTPGDDLNERLDILRRRFEEMLGNVNAEKKLSSVGVAPNPPTPPKTALAHTTA